MRPKFYIQDAGGLGDVIRNYIGAKFPLWNEFSNYRGWGRLTALRKIYPHAYITAVINTKNPTVRDLLQYDRRLDSVDIHPWVWPHTPWEGVKLYESAGYKNVIDTCDELGIKEGKHNLLPYLGGADLCIMKELEQYKPYIFLHPFAGFEKRMPNRPSWWHKFADEFFRTLPYNIVVIGGYQYDRHLNSKKERWTNKHPRILNLVGRCNPRIALHALHQSIGIACFWSCYVVAARTYNKPSVVVAPYSPKGKHCHAYQKAKKHKMYQPKRDLCIHCTHGKNDRDKTKWAVQHFHKVLGR